MVTKTSAERIGRFTRDIEHLPSHADHRGLVRFEHSQDGRYVSLIEKLKSMAANAQQTVIPLARYSYTRNEVQSGKYRHLSIYCHVYVELSLAQCDNEVYVELCKTD